MLLGYTAQSAVGNFPTGVSNSVRDSAIAFINALVSPSSDSKSRELCDHILDALLVGLEKAFLSFDVPTAKAYFNFVVQLANAEIKAGWLLSDSTGLCRPYSLLSTTAEF